MLNKNKSDPIGPSV